MSKRRFYDYVKVLLCFVKKQPLTLLFPLALIFFGICYVNLWQKLELDQQITHQNIKLKEARIVQLGKYANSIGNFDAYRAKRQAEIKALEKRLENSRTPVEQLRFLQNSTRECSLLLTNLKHERGYTDKNTKGDVEGFRLSLSGEYFNLLRWLKLLEEKSQARFYHFGLSGNEKTGLISLDAFIIF